MSHSLPVCSVRGLARELGGTVCNLADGADCAITDPTLRSSETQQGWLYVACVGTNDDGHRFIGDAFTRGAAAALVSTKEALGGRPGVCVGDTRLVLSKVAKYFYGDPSRDMTVVGVTGTNGKTTTNWLIHSAMRELFGGSLRIGTLGIRWDTAKGVSFENPDTLTTPDIFLLTRSLRGALDSGIKHAVMETSSHALDQGRLSGVAFDVGIFTNLTRDHLDYHRDMNSYYAAKKKLFENIVNSGKLAPAGVINVDHLYGAQLARELSAWPIEVVTVGHAPDARVRIESFTQSRAGSELVLAVDHQVLTIRTPFIGEHNAENIACATGALVAVGAKAVDLVKIFPKLPQVPGRLQVVPHPQVGVYVDYAHTPDALEHVLKALRPITEGKLWVVFGCGGDRDKGKRPQMGEIASRLADRVVVTSDNPRTEVAQTIVDDILVGAPNAAFVDVDREAAIGRAIAEAETGDVVLIAGKGHEDYQIIGTTKRPFSDVGVAEGVLRRRSDS